MKFLKKCFCHYEGSGWYFWYPWKTGLQGTLECVLWLCLAQVLVLTILRVNFTHPFVVLTLNDCFFSPMEHNDNFFLKIFGHFFLV